MADFKTQHEQQVWDDLISDIEDVEELKTPAAAARLVGAVAAAVSQLEITPAIQRQLTQLLQRIDAAVKKGATNATDASKLLKDATTSLRTTLDNAAARYEIAQRRKEKMMEQALKTNSQAQILVIKAQLAQVQLDLEQHVSLALMERQKELELALELLKKEEGAARQALVATLKASGNQDVKDRLARVEHLLTARQKASEVLPGSAVDLSALLVASTRKIAESTGVIRPGSNLGLSVSGNTIQTSGGGATLLDRIQKVVEVSAQDTRKLMNTNTSVLTDRVENLQKHVLDLSMGGMNSEGKFEKYKEEKLERQRNTLLSLFRTKLDVLRDIVKESEDKGVGFGGLLGSILGAKGLGAVFKGGKGGMKLLMASLGGFALTAAKGMSTRLISLLKTAGKFAKKHIFKIIPTIFRFLGKRAVWAIPVVGPIVGALLLANDVGLLDGLKSWLNPHIEELTGKIGEGVGKMGEFFVNSFHASIDTIKSYVDPIYETVTNTMAAVHDTLYKPYSALRDTLNDYAEYWKDTPVLGTVMGKLAGFMNDPFGTVQSAINSKIGSAYSMVKDLAIQIPDMSINSVIASGKGKLGEISDSVSSKFNSVRESVSSGVADTFGISKGSVDSAISMVGSAGASAAPAAYKGASVASSYLADKAGDALSWIGNSASNLFSTAGNVDMDNVDPGFSGSFMHAIKDYKEMGGKHNVILTSGYRSIAHQAKLHEQDPKRAAPPGRSLHNFGLAIDADRKALNDMDKMGLLDKWGLSRPVKGEPWHVQPKGISLAAAKRGIYSADNPKHQASAMVPKTTVRPAATTGPSSKAVDVVDNMMTGGSRAVSTNKQVVKEPPRTSVSQSIGVEDVPTFSFADEGFFASNIGALMP